MSKPVSVPSQPRVTLPPPSRNATALHPAFARKDNPSEIRPLCDTNLPTLFFPTQRRCPAVVLWTVWNFHLRGQRLLSGSGCISNWNRFDRSRKPGVLSPWTASGPPGTGRERILARNNNTLRRGDLPVWMWKRAHCDTAPKRVLFAPGVGSFAYQRCEVGAFGPSENVSGHYRWRSSGQNLWDFLPLKVGWVWPRFYWNIVLNIWNFFLLKVCKRWFNLGLDVWSLYFNLRLKFTQIV